MKYYDSWPFVYEADLFFIYGPISNLKTFPHPGSTSRQSWTLQLILHFYYCTLNIVIYLNMQAIFTSGSPNTARNKSHRRARRVLITRFPGECRPVNRFESSVLLSNPTCRLGSRVWTHFQEAQYLILVWFRPD
jgi:hypothetical protein